MFGGALCTTWAIAACEPDWSSTHGSDMQDHCYNTMTSATVHVMVAPGCQHVLWQVGVVLVSRKKHDKMKTTYHAHHTYISNNDMYNISWCCCGEAR
jgi:hypothetical protein